MSHDHGQRCLCSQRHQPTPLELARHHILPQENGGPNSADNYVWLCPTAHVNVHELLRLMLAAEGGLTWGQVGQVYDVPVSRWAYEVASEGWRRIEGQPWRGLQTPEWAQPVHVHGQLEIAE